MTIKINHTDDTTDIWDMSGQFPRLIGKVLRWKPGQYQALTHTTDRPTFAERDDAVQFVINYETKETA